MRGNAANFDNFGGNTYSDQYDPSMDGYDPDNANGPMDTTTNVRVARPGQKLQLNISVSNATAKDLLVELFSALDSVATRLKAEYVNAPYNYVPSLSFEGLALAGVGCVGYNQAGNLEIRGGALDPKCTVGCGEYPYNSLVESTKVLPFDTAFLRYTVDTDAQIDNNITHFQKTFGGGVKENTISPRAYFKPNQFQAKTIDILAPFTIDGEKGLRIPVNAGENIRLALFIQRWGKPGL
jgi:hypothetical protein